MTRDPAGRLGRAFFLLSLPILLGLILALVLQSKVLPNPVLIGQITVDLGTLVFLAGLVLSGLGSAGAIVSWYWRRRSTRMLTAAHQRWDDGHRRFIHRLDHEIKNPLATLQVSLTSLQQQTVQGDQESQLLQSAQEQITRLRRLLQDMRKLADLETYPLERESINLAVLLHDAIAAVREVSGQSERSVSMITPQIPWSPTPVQGDSDLLALAFYNLLNNAFKYTDLKDAIEILIREDSTTVTVDIADSGPGIIEADLPHIFEELYRGESARQVEGSGLGLALVKKIVERHGGQITVRSRVGQGTVFTVRLPLLPDKK